MIESLGSTKMWEAVDHSLISSLLSRISSTVECTICSEIMAVPVTAECGHSFCYGCIYQWFTNKVNCPTCRHEIDNKPTLNLQLKEICKNILDIIIESRLENFEVLKNHKLESENNYNLDVKNKSLFGDLFNSAVTLIDHSDGVPRCSNCHWEAHGSVCAHCGTRFRINPNSRYSGDNDDDEDEDEENFQDVMGGYHRELDAYDSEDSFIDSRTANEIPIELTDEEESVGLSDDYEVDEGDDDSISLLSIGDDYQELVLDGHMEDEWHGFESASSSMLERTNSSDSDNHSRVHRESIDQDDVNEHDDSESHTQDFEDDDNDLHDAHHGYSSTSPPSDNIVQLSGNEDDEYYDSEDLREALDEADMFDHEQLDEDLSDGGNDDEDALEYGYDSSDMVHGLEDDFSDSY